MIHSNSSLLLPSPVQGLVVDHPNQLRGSRRRQRFGSARARFTFYTARSLSLWLLLVRNALAPALPIALAP
jgi:hypothetical protein